MAWLRRLFVALCSGLFIIGCIADAPPPLRVDHGGLPAVRVHVYITNEYDDNEVFCIKSGIAMWERAGAGLISVDYSSVDKEHSPSDQPGFYDGASELVVTFRKAHASDKWVQEWDAKHSPSMLLGMLFGTPAKAPTDAYLVNDRMEGAQMRAIIAAHEFGHAIGLDHVVDKNSVMSAFYAYEVQTLTKNDLVELCSMYECALLPE